MATACLHHRLLHSRSQSAAAAPKASSPRPRVMVWLHSLLSNANLYIDLAQDAIDRAAAATREDWVAVLLDHRCHGQSWGLPGLDGPHHDVETLAGDVLRTLVAGGWGRLEVLVGHSISGLAALEVTRRLAQAAKEGQPAELAALGVPKQVWTLDSRTFAWSPETEAAKGMFAYVAMLCELPEPFDSVRDLEKASEDFMREKFNLEAVPPWRHTLLSHTIKPAPAGTKGYVRQFDAAAMREFLHAYCRTDFRGFIEDPPPGCTLHIVRGLASDHWFEDGEEELAALRRLQEAGKGVRLHEMEGADHWIPITHKKELLGLMEGTFGSLRAQEGTAGPQ